MRAPRIQDGQSAPSRAFRGSGSTARRRTEGNRLGVNIVIALFDRAHI